MEDGIKLLYATAENHTLLYNGKAKLIGQTYNAKQYLSDGSVSLLQVVEFNYGDPKIRDLFFFENDQIVFHSISLHTEAYLTDRYSEMLQVGKVAPEQFISKITGLYTFKRLGFMD